MTGWTLRVVWPIHDPAMYETEAVAAATFEWPWFAEKHQVTVTGSPTIRVVPLGVQQQVELRADRAVVCEAPVIRRQEATR